MRKAYAYIRVSTIDQAENGFSIDAQKEAAKAYYDVLVRQERYADLEWAGFYSDEGRVHGSYRSVRENRVQLLLANLRKGIKLYFVSSTGLSEVLRMR